MKIKLIALSIFSICVSFQQLWSQEAPKLAATSVNELAPGNRTRINELRPEMAVWRIDEPNKNNTGGDNRNIIPELKASKLEDNPKNDSK